jgi:hypothetical protein
VDAGAAAVAALGVDKNGVDAHRVELPLPPDVRNALDEPADAWRGFLDIRQAIEARTLALFERA